MPKDIVLLVKARVAEWALLRKEFFGMNLDCILQNWEACMSCGPSKDSKVVCWLHPPSDQLKFNVDGVAKGKPEPIGIGGVLRNDAGEVLFMFFKNVGIKESNEAGVLAILEALMIFFLLSR